MSPAMGGGDRLFVRVPKCLTCEPDFASYHCFLGLLYPCFPESKGCSSHRLRHRASPASKGGTLALLIPARPEAPPASDSGQSSADARRACEPDCRQPPRCFTNPTPVPLNNNWQRIQSVPAFGCRVAPALALGLRSHALHLPALRLWSLRVGGSRARCARRRACASADSPLTLLPPRR